MAHTRISITARTSSAGNPIAATVVVPAGCTVLALLLNVVGVSVRAGGAPTWGPYALTQANTQQIASASPEASAELWYLLNPIAGSATLTIPNTGGLTIKYTVEGGAAAGGGHSAFEAANGANTAGTPAANPSPGAVTITEAGEIAWAVTAGGWQTWAPSAQAGTVIANTDDGANGGGEQYSLNPAIGALTLGWTFATTDDWGAVVAAFKEVPPQMLENYKRPRSVGLSVGGIG